MKKRLFESNLHKILDRLDGCRVLAVDCSNYTEGAETIVALINETIYRVHEFIDDHTGNEKD